MIYYRKKNLAAVAEIWYNFGEKPSKKADILRYKYVEEKQEGAASFEKLYTLRLDLKKSGEELFGGFKNNTRYEINRAVKKDALECHTLLAREGHDDAALGFYLDFFKQFALGKGRLPLKTSEIEHFYRFGTLCIRGVKKEGGEDFLTLHGYTVSDGTARLLHSASHFRNSADNEYRSLVGRANRMLHWEDILYFKNAGLDWYDFGGWYGGNEDQEMLAINQFKESFGGEKKEEYSFILPASPLGGAALFFHGLLKKAKNVLAG